MGALWVTLLLAATDFEATAPPVIEAPAVEREPVEPPPALTEPFIATFRVTLLVTAGASPASLGKLGGGLDLAFMPLSFLRLHAGLAGHWIPTFDSRYYGSIPSDLDVTSGVDGVLPFVWGELFAGLETGATLTNTSANNFGCFDCGFGYTSFQWGPLLRLRAGVDFTRLRPLIIGAGGGYTVFARGYQGDVHWLEGHARLGFGF